MSTFTSPQPHPQASPTPTTRAPPIIEVLRYMSRPSRPARRQGRDRRDRPRRRPGTTAEDALLFPKVLVASLKNRVGQTVLATLTQGVAKPGQSAPWTLTDATGDPAAVKRATDFDAYKSGGLAAPEPAVDAATAAASAAEGPGTRLTRQPCPATGGTGSRPEQGTNKTSTTSRRARVTADMTDYDPVAAVTTQLADGGYRVTRAAGGWIAQCPAHDDRNPSLSIAAGADGGSSCTATPGCGIRDILDALGLPPAAMFTDYQPDRPAPSPTQPRPRLAPPPTRRRTQTQTPPPREDPPLGLPRPPRRHRRPRRALQPRRRRHRRDRRQDVHAARLGRRAPAAQPRRPGYAAVPPAHRPRGRHAGPPVYAVEGERDADTLAALRLTATTCPMGAGSWRPWHTEALSGAADVRIIADNDEPGLAHARHIADEPGAAATILLPADGCKDATEHSDAGHTSTTFVMLGELDGRRRARRVPALDWHALWADDSRRNGSSSRSSPPAARRPLLPAEGRQVAAAAGDRRRRRRGADVPAPARPPAACSTSTSRTTRSSTPATGSKPWATPPPTSETSSSCRSRRWPRWTPKPAPSNSSPPWPRTSARSSSSTPCRDPSAARRTRTTHGSTSTAHRAALKQAQVSLIRPRPHRQGRDEGQRGGSAKSGDVDAVWRMSKVTDTTFRLECEAAARLPITEKTLVIHRETRRVLRHGSTPPRHGRQANEGRRHRRMAGCQRAT